MTIDGDRLVVEAVESAALDDFGPDSWREGYEVLVESLNAEARLTEMGEAILGARLGGYLVNRLRVIDCLAANPAIARTAIEGPLLVTGLPRTGTTALSNLLAADPATRALQVWESADPVPPPDDGTYLNDPRIATAAAGIEMLHQMVPEIRAMHDDTATSTAEALDLLGMTFATHHFNGMAHIPTYDRWWLECDMTAAYDLHRRTLQLLGWHTTPQRWHLKNPPDVFCLDTVAATYPDTVFVWTHRDPAAVLPSVASLIATVRSMATDDLEPATIGPELLDLWSIGIERAIDTRERLGDHRFIDVVAADLLTDPIATVERVYDQAGWTFTGAAADTVSSWAAANPAGRHGEHRPDPIEFGVDADIVRDRFATYLDQYEELWT